MTSGGSMNTFSVRRHAVTKTFSGGLHHPPTEAWVGLGGQWKADPACFPLDFGGCHPQFLQRHFMRDAICVSVWKSHGTGAIGLAAGIT